IPSSILDETRKRQEANEWAAGQRAILAQEWADNQRRIGMGDLRALEAQSRQLPPAPGPAESFGMFTSKIGQAAGALGEKIGELHRPIEQKAEVPTGWASGYRPAPEVKPFLPTVLDLAGRPQQALFGGISAAQQGGDIAEAIRRGLVGEQRVEGEQLLEQAGMQPGLARSALGLGAEIVADPLNVVPLGWAGKAGKLAGIPEKLGPAVSRVASEAPGVLADASRAVRPLVPALSVEDVSKGAPSPPTAVTPPESADAAVSWLPTVKRSEDILQGAYTPDWTRRLADKFDNPVTRNVAQAMGLPKRDVFTQGLVLRESIMADWKSALTGATARLRQQGSSSKLFNVDKDGIADIGGTKAAITDVLEYPDRYNLTAEQRQYASTIHKLYDDQKLALASEGIDIRELGFDEGGHYVGRKVMGKVNETGEVELATVGGAKRIGARAGFEKGRDFETQTEAIEAGYRYLTPEEALQANLEATGRRIADKRLAAHILEQIPYRTASAPEELILARDYAKEKLGAAALLEQAAKRAYRGERLPTATIAKIGRYFPDEARALAEAGAREIGGATRPFKDIQLPSVFLKAELQRNYYRAQNAVTKALERARQPRYDESMVMSPAFQGKFFSTEDAKKLRQVLDLEQQSPIRGAARTVSWVNALPRLLLTTFDLGPMLIQGQTSLLSHPVVWSKAVSRSLQALASEKGYQSFLAAHADTINKWSQEGASFTPSEFTASIHQGGIAAKTPGLRTAVKPFARGFEALLNAGKIYGLEATEHLAKTPADRAGLAKFWNEMLGTIDTARMGVSPTQREIETAVLFAPRYRRAVYALMTDISKGGLRGKMARDALGKVTLAGLAGYVGVAAALGQEPHLDPSEGAKFMTVEVAGQNIGLGGALYSTTRALAQIAMEPDRAAEIAAKYVSNSLSPVAGIPTDVVQFPYAYAGGLKFTKRVLAENLTPIWMQATLLDEQRGEGAIAATAAELAGLRTFPDRQQPQTGAKSPITQYLDRMSGSTGAKRSPVQQYLDRMSAQ
ncbi:MAG: hypothetical protein M0R06_22700, partial [Sphaerochaeta sp.]|nr:hypothetical protein [Sphaerochaeta sp.]